MKRRLIIPAVFGGTFLLALTALPAGAQTTVNDLVGDIDCFGNSGVSTCDGGSYGTYASGSDPSFTDRSYSNGGPSWTHSVSVNPANIFSAVLTFRQMGMGTCCSSTTNVFLNNVLLGQVGVQSRASTHSFNVNPALLVQGSNTASISLGWGDVWAMDYSNLSYSYNDPTVTPEPVSMALLGTGLAGLGAVRRRRRKLDDVG